LCHNFHHEGHKGKNEGLKGRMGEGEKGRKGEWGKQTKKEAVISNSLSN
jgi:hypothetical protein